MQCYIVATIGNPADIGNTYENKVLGTELINGTMTTKTGVFPHAKLDGNTYEDF
ncbi:MAG: hypothetical protein HY808_07360 [Nitrospirae bacterium]|nr:hypothetical protein [Nitrospirota bacterium]